MRIILIIIYLTTLLNKCHCQFHTVYPLIFNSIDSLMVNRAGKKDLSCTTMQTPRCFTETEIAGKENAGRKKAISKFSFPLRKNIITSGYGWRYHPVFHRYRMHYGIDLKARFEPVYAMYSGVVSFVGYGKMEGKYIKIVNGDVEILFAHLSRMLVKKGDKVESGQNIAFSGESGMVTGPHLHVGIKIHMSYIDPINLMELVGKGP